MPQKALVTFGVVCGLGLLTLLSVFGASPILALEQDDSRLAATKPKVPFINNTAPLTLKEALSQTLQHSPLLAAFSQEVKARDHEVQQAGLFPNPEFSIEVENVAGSGSFSGTDNAETTIRLSQLIELGGKRHHRKALGSSQHEVAQREYDLVKAEAVAETKARFIAVLAAQMRFSLVEEEIALAQKVLHAVDDRIAAGKSTALESIRFQSLVSEARLHQENIQQELRVARRALAWALGKDAADFGKVHGNIDIIKDIPGWPEVLSKLEQSPEINLQKSMGKGIAHQLDLEQANRIPDLTFSLGGKNDQDSGDNALVAELSIPLPLFNGNKYHIEAARARQEKARNEQKAAQLKVRMALIEVFQKLQRARREAATLRDEILPASQKIFNASTYGYKAGKFGFLVVLEAEKTLFKTKERHIDSLETYHKAIVELEKILGQKISSDGEPSIS